MTEMTDKRKHLRLPLQTRTFIELVSTRVDDGQPGRLVTCQTLNVSRGGLQVAIEEAVPVGAILQIGVELPEAAAPLYLAGEVRWCRDNEGDKERPWRVGFMLLNATGSDLENWVELLRGLQE